MTEISVEQFNKEFNKIFSIHMNDSKNLHNALIKIAQKWIPKYPEIIPIFVDTVTSMHNEHCPMKPSFLGFKVKGTNKKIVSFNFDKREIEIK